MCVTASFRGRGVSYGGRVAESMPTLCAAGVDSRCISERMGVGLVSRVWCTGKVNWLAWNSDVRGLGGVRAISRFLARLSFSRAADGVGRDDKSLFDESLAPQSLEITLQVQWLGAAAEHDTPSRLC